MDSGSARRGAMRGLVAASLLTALALLGACALPVYGEPGPQTVTSLAVVRTSPISPNHLAPFAETVTDAGKTRKLYNALLALPAFPSGPMACPADFGVEYHLTFFRDAAVVARVIVQPEGCQWVSLTNDDTHWTRWAATSPGFWRQFADTLGVPESTIFETPQPNGPPTPTAAPGG